MKSVTRVFAWIGVVLGALAIIGGLSEINTDPTNAYYSLVGGALFATMGITTLIYVNQTEGK